MSLSGYWYKHTWVNSENIGFEFHSKSSPEKRNLNPFQSGIFLLEWQFRSKSDYIIKVCYFALKMINSTTKLTFDFVIFNSVVEHLNATYFGRKK